MTAARAEYDRLLKEAADKAAADAVTELINALPDADSITLSDKSAVEEVRGAYDALTDEQKAYVTEVTLKKLTDAEEALRNMKNLERIYGNTRYETSLEVAKALKNELGIGKFDTVVVACGNGYADALSASYLANVKNAPVILASATNIDASAVGKPIMLVGGSLTETQKEYLATVESGSYIMIGGPTLISDDAAWAVTGNWPQTGA